MDCNEQLELTNHFQEIANQDEDHDDLVESLKQLAHNVQIGPKPSQKMAKATRLSPQRITAIARDINSGKIKLPDLDLPTDKDYVAVWALVDSGSSVHVVNAEQICPGAKIHPPPPGHGGG